MEKKYLMESEVESFRLDFKVDKKTIHRQVKWAGIKKGMRVADLGCGSGAITSILHDLVQPGGSVVGIDRSKDRLDYAKQKYSKEGISFILRDLTGPLEDIGEFDFILVRFVLEYHLSQSPAMVRSFVKCLKGGGIICLIDLDHNPVNWYGATEKLESTFKQMINLAEEKFDFDPYAGRKLYSYLYDSNLLDIDVKVENHKVFFGEIDEFDVFNLLKKLEIVPAKMNFTYDHYPGGFEEFFQDAKQFLSSPRRFAYSPLILCRGIKPK